MGLLFVPIGYETIIQSLQKVLDGRMRFNTGNLE